MEMIARGSSHLDRLVRAPMRPQTYRNLCYLLLMFPLGLGYFVLLSVGFPLGIGLVTVLVGIPLLVILLGFAVGLAGIERTLVGSLLAVEIPSSPVEPRRGLRNRTEQLVTSRSNVESRRVPVERIRLRDGRVHPPVVVGRDGGELSARTGVLLPGTRHRVRSDSDPTFHPRHPVRMGQLARRSHDDVRTRLVARRRRFPVQCSSPCLGALLLLCSLHLLNALARSVGTSTPDSC